MEADFSLSLSFPGQELHSIGSYALIAVTEPPRQILFGLDTG